MHLPDIHNAWKPLCLQALAKNEWPLRANPAFRNRIVTAHQVGE